MKYEGVIAGSNINGGGGTPDMGEIPINNSQSRGRYNAASGSEIEDMINNIFTIEQ